MATTPGAAEDTNAASGPNPSQTPGPNQDQDPAAGVNPVGPRIRRSRWKRRLLIAGLVAIALAAALILPPLINISRYQRQVTALVSRSLGRPVRLSSVDLRLLPTPGFVLHDLYVGEDPAFGAEPTLFARTVVASVRLLALWTGRIEVSRISLDEASLNLVRTADGKWSTASLMNGAAVSAGGNHAGRAPASTSPAIPARFPYLEATNSRVNIKLGTEKSPYSLVNADLSLWQDSPGQWQARLRGQPARTDVEMTQEDTGELRMNAAFHSAPALRDMPLRLQLEWRDAQLGQLSRMVLGSDAGWRGGVTAEVNVEGSSESAQTTARLRVDGLRREEFAPESTLDFDASCAFRYQHSVNAVHDIVCDSDSGGGQLHLKAELPGTVATPAATPTPTPQISLEAKDIPLQAGLDLVHLVRNGFAPGIAVRGTASGTLTYAVAAPPAESHPAHLHRVRVPLRPASLNTPSLSGSLAVTGAILSGGALPQPLTLPRFVFTALQPPAPPANTRGRSRPVPAIASTTPQPLGLETQFAVSFGQLPQPAVASAKAFSSQQQAITLHLLLTSAGYEAAVTGSAGPARLRELAYALGAPSQPDADNFTGGIADLDLHARGTWVAPGAILNSKDDTAPNPVQPAPDGVTAPDTSWGSIRLHNLQWKPPYLANPVELSSGTVVLSPTDVLLNADFSLPAGARIPRPVSEPAKRAVKTTPAASDQAQGSDTKPEQTEAPVQNPTPVLNSSPGAIQGSLSLSAPIVRKPSDDESQPQLQLRFTALDAAALQAALFEGPKSSSVLSPILSEVDRLRSPQPIEFPALAVRVQADSLTLGSIILLKPVLALHTEKDKAIIDSWHAGLAGGLASGAGTLAWSAAQSSNQNEAQPQYTLAGTFTRVSPAEIAALLNPHESPGPRESSPLPAWTGGPISGRISLQLTGTTSQSLAASTTGELEFQWPHGEIPLASANALSTSTSPLRFDSWTGKVTFQAGRARLGDNSLVSGTRRMTLNASIPYGSPVKFSPAPAIRPAGQPVSAPPSADHPPYPLPRNPR